MRHLFFAEQIGDLSKIRQCTRAEAEAERIESLGRGDRIAEGISATRPEWGRYTGVGALRTSIAYERIPDGFWLDDFLPDYHPTYGTMYSLHIFEAMNSAFIDLRGYIHIRVLQHDAPRLALPVRAEDQLNPTIRATIERLGKPPGQFGWKRFCDAVRANLGKTQKDRGYSDKTISAASDGPKRTSDRTIGQTGLYYLSE